MTPPPILLLFRYAFLLVLAWFVLRVLRAVLADLDVREIAGPPQAVLAVEAPEALRGREFLVSGETTIGRSPGCAIVLTDDYVSARHARVFERGGRVWVEDLGSTNGTLLNGQRLRKRAPLRPGDRLRVGAMVLRLRVEPPPAAGGDGSGRPASHGRGPSGPGGGGGA